MLSMRQLQNFFVFSIVFTVAFCKKEPLFKFKPRTTECGPSSCHAPRPGYINVHLVPHSHDDTGWLKTVDQYYYGAKQSVQRAGVQYIIESVVKELANDPDKRFIQVETGFFWRWWEDKNEFMRNMTRQLVEAGQLVFTGGGWSMNDEAVTHYASIIDNMETGLNWLVDNLGSCAVPSIGWQIDPFGHSKEQARLFAEIGFEGLFFARIDYQDKDSRKANQGLQMWWEGGEEGDKNRTIFTGVFDNHYSHPEGFCFDIICTDEPINDDPRLDEFNVDFRIKSFVDVTLKHLQYYKDQEHIMFTMGDDFTYQNARQNFKNMDKLIKYMNSRTEETGIHVMYSTPACYLEAIKSNPTVYPEKSDDFFPYGSGSHSYWTGYFTSRPAVKLQERLGARDLTVTRQIGILSDENNVKCEFDLHRAMGLMQHHDAVTGTEKQNVAEDYTLRLTRATDTCQQENINTLINRSNLDPGTLDLSLTSCPGLNVSSCVVTETAEQFLVLVYNPLSNQALQHVRIPVTDVDVNAEYLVYDHLGELLPTQINEIPEHIKNVPGRESLAEHELIFSVLCPPLGYTIVYVEKSQTKNSEIQIQTVQNLDNASQTLQILQNVTVSMEYYTGVQGIGQSSGAYVFRPDNSGRKKITDNPTVSQINGPLVNETIFTLRDWAVMSSRKYYDSDLIEVTWQVGPLEDGKEVVMVYQTNMNTPDFYTDANGRQMIKRVFNEDTFERAAANYYPVTNRIEKRIDGMAYSVITDRSQGGSSLNPGELELMVHRRCLYDDGYGVGEALKEEAFGQGLVARGQHITLSDDISSARTYQQAAVLSPQLSFMATSMSLDQWIQSGFQPYSAISQQLPFGIQVLTLSKWKSENQILLRLQHIYSKDENGEPTVVNLDGMFEEFTIVSLTEMKLAADRVLADMEGLEFEMEPLEIKTFVATVTWS